MLKIGDKLEGDDINEENLRIYCSKEVYMERCYDPFADLMVTLYKFGFKDLGVYCWAHEDSVDLYDLTMEESARILNILENMWERP